MKELNIPFIKPGQVTEDAVPTYAINTDAWKTNSNGKCEAAFQIFHDGESIHIHYAVKEPVLRAQKRPINSSVHLDNCVEFFIALNNDEAYYNFEFNCLGSVKAAFGEGRYGRSFLSAKALQSIANQLTISINNDLTDESISWEINVQLPLQIFAHHKLTSFSGLACAVNFTKCGDDLPQPHYLSFVNINTPQPDFHQRSYFAEAVFEPSGALISV